MRGRSLIFLGFTAASLVVYLPSLWALFQFTWADATFSYIPLVPLVSAWFLYENRKEIFVEGNRWHLPAGAPLVPAILLYGFGMIHGVHLAQENYLTIMALSFVSCWVGEIGLFYGGRALKAGAFPIFFLLFMVPIPTILLDKIVHFLQVWSADVAYIFFRLTGVPLHRDGFFFHLPGLTIEVAKECSGIRSSIALFLVSLLAGHLMLRENWRKGILTLSIIPIAIVKNAVRIVMLSLLAVYVDPRILGSMAHRRGGIPIFFLALVLLGGVLWLLRRGEKKGTKASS